ncbi:MAG: aromatic ring-hydroxylating dioxygenase subunit alpha [Gammaproteobacteria bacterium]|jgi:phenylpropionate dioxygenase-like ring-hydroxylating dioxygenase large terminal subunit|nr:aromatic ring-hydroxylating dioxygenase subunit alpha [Gammaproteobacteria bacterium]
MNAKEKISASSTFAAQYPELGTGPVGTDVYCDPAFYERELAAIFRRTWMCVGRVEQAPKPGDFFQKALPTFGYSVIVARAKDQKLRAFYNVCQHRGNHVELRQRGHCVGFTCPFHGWTYGLDGKLVGVPDASGFFDLDKSKLGLRQLALDVWEGFVFINMDPSPSQTLEEAMGEQGRDLVGYPFDSGTAVFEYEGTINCNWKSMIDSFCETYHVPVLHRHSVKDTLAGPDNPYGRLIDCRIKGPHRTQSVWGNMAYTPNPVQGLAWQNAPGPAVTSGVVDAAVKLPKGLNETRAKHWSLDVTVFFPNWIIVMGSGMYFTHQMWPLAANKVVWQMRGFLRPATNAAQRFGQENSMVELRDAVLEDCNTLERIQTAQDEGLITEMVYHDHEIALRHQYHVVKQWVEDFEKNQKKKGKGAR